MRELSMIAVDAKRVDAIVLFLRVYTAKTPFLDTSSIMALTQKRQVDGVDAEDGGSGMVDNAIEEPDMVSQHYEEAGWPYKSNL
ncbi:hypothetical protein F0562_014838 [Nyssa sinensis]|uniref:Uncharacterized protein n=1 Tax=Nyssa sinensis TaxID=561372 RepID=A0A5J4ZT68_9ASTE|nr:hypothetical protein F0562_014838 [Nyssa sinensis]